MSAVFTLRKRGVGEMLRSGQVRADLTDRAHAVLDAAIGSAPVVTGAYRDSLIVVQDETDRAVVRISTNISYAMVVESRTGILARALDSAGGG